MAKFLGRFPSDYGKNHTREQWALEYIMQFGGIDGDHHKAWVLDQVARVLHGTPVICEEARWDNGETDIVFSTGEPTQSYHDWVLECRGEYDEDEEEYEYDYDPGIAP